MMGWMETMFGVPDKEEPTAPELVEYASKWLEVTIEYGYGRDGVEYYDAEQFQPHLPDPSTLTIQRNGQRAPVAHYGPNGWLRFRWVMKRASEVADRRADRSL